MDPIELDIGDRTQFMVDDSILADTAGLERRFHPFEKVSDDPVLTMSEPWEGPFLRCAAVLRDAGTGEWRMWYNNFGPRAGGLPAGSWLLEARSKDGIRWEKPPLGVWPNPDHPANNITVFPGGTPALGACGLFEDADDPDPARRFKMIYYKPNYYLAVSPDGRRWTPAQADPVWPNGAGDGLEETHFFLRDEAAGGYRGYMRVWRRHQTVRKVALGSSPDLANWEGPRIIWEAVPEWGMGAQIYGMLVWKEGGVYWGLPWVFYGEEPLQAERRQSIVLKAAWSRDGREWHAVFPGRDALPMGEAGSFDAGMVIANCQIVPDGERLRLYYTGAMGRHDASHTTCSVGLAERRPGGFVSLHAGEEGSLITHRFLFCGEELRINARTRPDGGIVAELLDDYGCVMKAFSAAASDVFNGDAVDHVLSWGGKSRLDGLRGQMIRLRLTLRRAELFSFRAAGRPELFAAPPEPPPVRCGRCFSPPVIDGELSDDCWEDFARTGTADEFVKFEEALPALVKTRILATHDALNLYLAAECDEPALSAIKPGEPGSPIRYNRDETLEFRLSAPSQRSFFNQLMVTPDGRQAQAWFSKEEGGTRAIPDIRWIVRTSSIPGRWTAELAIPFAALNAEAPKPGETWKFNVIRYRHAGGDDVSCWSCLFGSVHRNDRAGRLVF
jgi:hypothetical protein